MKNNKAGEHTQGNWHVEANHTDKAYVHTPKRNLKIAICPSGSDKPDDESIANAKLIAAAPDMLKALEKIVYILAGGNANEADLYLNSHEMQAAINKAKGI